MFFSKIATVHTVYNIQKSLKRELGKSKTAIDLDCSKLTSDQMEEIEEECNRIIRNHSDVKVHVYESAKDSELQKVVSSVYWRYI